VKERYIILLCFVISILFLSCSKQNAEHEINRLMDKRESAFNSKQLKSYLTVFSSKYKDKKGGIGELRERMKKNFDMFKTIRFVHINRDIFVKEDKGKVVQNFTLTFAMDIDGKEEKRSIKGKEKFNLEKAGSNWLIVEGE